MSTILIVDNEPAEISLLRGMLEDEDYEFVAATSADEAREAVRTRGAEITAVLLEWLLPDADGVELLAWMKSQAELADVEVVVQSTEFVRENVESAIDRGAYYYLTKPFDQARVEAIVHAAVASCEARRRLVEKVEEAQDTFRLLDAGRFLLRRVREAELLAVHISSGCGQPDASMGLMELLVNAVEHGNLEISYEEKGRLLAESRLDQERRRRLDLPRYRGRRARVDLQRTAGAMKIAIQDEGEGFDFEKYLVLDRKRLFDAHGRGILLATATLDLAYAPPGNRVEVTLPVVSEQIR